MGGQGWEIGGLHGCSWGPSEPPQMRVLPSLGLCGAGETTFKIQGLFRSHGDSLRVGGGEWEITEVGDPKLKAAWDPSIL